MTTHVPGPSRPSAAFAAALEVATNLQKEIAGDLTPEYLAVNGPTVPDVRGGMIYVQRAWHALIIAVKQRANPARIAQLMSELAGAAIKVSMDLSKPRIAPEMFGPVEEGTDDD